MNILLFEEFKVKKVKKIYKHLDSDRGGVTSIVGSLDKDSDYSETGVADTALDTLNYLMNKLSKRFKLNKVKYLNAGAYGMAFISGNKIIKLTSNRSEAAVVKGLIKRNIPNTVRYYDIVFIRKYDIYAILMDRADKIPVEELQLIDMLCNYASIKDMRSYSFSNFKDSCRDTKGSTLSVEKLKSIYNGYKELLTSLEENKISTRDLHSENVGYINGKLVHFDIMDENTKMNDIKKISKVKLK